MLEHSAENGLPRQAEPCEHFYAWLSPAGARLSARICQGCGWPDPEWLNHIIEVDRGHGPSCVHCAFADTRVTSPEMDA